jgi:acetyltransferase
VIAEALHAGREWLTEPEAKSVLAAYRIPVVETGVALTVEDAVVMARAVGHPAALKILSPDITHKSDVGGVALDLADDAEVRAAGERMLAQVRAAAPAAQIDGFAVQRMVRRPRAHELIVGASEDAQFGPVVLFGQGGTAAEVVADRALALPPLNMRLAYDLMAQTRVHRLLRGYRDRPAADLDAVALVLLKVAQLVTDLAEVAELDINPLLADGDGVIALDARIRVAQTGKRAEERLAIRPYPKELEEEVSLADGHRLCLRPIRPEDEPALVMAFRKLSPETVRLRFFAPLKELTHQAAARLTQIDYDREMALVLVDHESASTAEIYAVARIAADPDNTTAEFAVAVRDDVAGMGLGTLLMRRLIDHARRRGLSELFGHVLHENSRMLGICRRLGFRQEPDPEVPRITVVRLAL